MKKVYIAHVTPNFHWNLSRMNYFDHLDIQVISYYQEPGIIILSSYKDLRDLTIQDTAKIELGNKQSIKKHLQFLN